MQGFRHSTKVQVRFKDMDAMGHVNNANHLTYIEQARIVYFSEVVGKNINWDKKGIILASVKVDYLKPVMFGDELVVFTRCTRLGNKSFDLEYLITKEKGREPELLARAVTTLVCFDYERNSSMGMDPEWRSKIVDFEGIKP